jgi:hypothetical protein
VLKHCYLKNKLGKTQARAKGIMKLTKDNLMSAIADLIIELMETGYDSSRIAWTLRQYGFTKEQIAEWYGIGE